MITYRAWLAYVDAELRAQGYPPSCDLFMGGWRLLYQMRLTPAEAVPAGVANQREAVKGFYPEGPGNMTHDTDWRIVLGGIAPADAMREYYRTRSDGETLAAWLGRMNAELWPDEPDALADDAIADMARQLERDAEGGTE